MSTGHVHVETGKIQTAATTMEAHYCMKCHYIRYQSDSPSVDLFGKVGPHNLVQNVIYYCMLKF